MSEFEGWSDRQLLDYEEYLYDCERDGDNTWDARDRVLWEMNRRGLYSRKSPKS